MANKDGDIVLITGGSGFLGQHLVKLLQEKDNDVKEIRILDLKPYENKLNHAEDKPIISYIGDVCDVDQIEDAFANVNIVFHLAVYYSFQHPPQWEKLENVNVNGTKNIVNLCIKHNVSRLIYTSCTSVTLTHYLGKVAFSIVINQTESKVKPVMSDSDLIIPGYATTKLRAEKIVLGANRTNLSQGSGELVTTAIRPTVMYGEEDHLFFPTMAKWANKFGGVIPRFLGAGGKHQMTYVGNVAHGLVLAKNVMKKDSTKIGGLPVFITDDTPIEDSARFCQRLSRHTKVFNMRPTSCFIPSFVAWFSAIFIHLILAVLNPIFGIRLPFQPLAIVGYSGSILLFSRLRAELHMDYEPLFNEETSTANSVKWYEKWYESNFNGNKKLKAS